MSFMVDKYGLPYPKEAGVDTVRTDADRAIKEYTRELRRNKAHIDNRMMIAIWGQHWVQDMATDEDGGVTTTHYEVIKLIDQTDAKFLQEVHGYFANHTYSRISSSLLGSWYRSRTSSNISPDYPDQLFLINLRAKTDYEKYFTEDQFQRMLRGEAVGLGEWGVPEWL